MSPVSMEFTNHKIKESWLGNTNGHKMSAAASLGPCLACLQHFLGCAVLCLPQGKLAGKQGSPTILPDTPSHTQDSLLPSVLVPQIFICVTAEIQEQTPKEFLLQIPRLTGFAQTPHQSSHKAGRLRNNCILHCSPGKHAEIFWILGSWDIEDGFPLVLQQAGQEILCHPLI